MARAKNMRAGMIAFAALSGLTAIRGQKRGFYFLSAAQLAKIALLGLLPRCAGSMLECKGGHVKRIVLLAVLAMLLGVAAQTMAAQKWMLVVNKTEEQIKGISFSPAGQNKWGEDQLDKYKLKKDQHIKVDVPHDLEGCKWDIKLTVREKMVYYLKDVELCNIAEIDLFVKDDAVWYYSK